MHRDVSRELHHRRMEVHLKGGYLLRTLHFAESNSVEVRADAVVVLKGTFRKGKYNAKSWQQPTQFNEELLIGQNPLLSAHIVRYIEDLHLSRSSFRRHQSVKWEDSVCVRPKARSARLLDSSLL